MKTRILLLLLTLMVGCASPYYPVYVNSEGDHYIAERASSGAYLGADSLMLMDIGLYPWWINSYPPQAFVYYSPYYYPHFFPVWYPPGFYPYYSYYGRYYSCPRPPHWNHPHHGQGGATEIAHSPALPAAIHSESIVRNPGLRYPIERSPSGRDLMNSRKTGPSPVVSTPSLSRALPDASTRNRGSVHSAGISRSPGRSAPVSRRPHTTSVSPAKNRQ